MKTALYMEDGVLQVVLTPEDEFEKNILSLVEKKEQLQMYRGSFYHCNGGWLRQKAVPVDSEYSQYSYERQDHSLIMVVQTTT